MPNNDGWAIKSYRLTIAAESDPAGCGTAMSGLSASGTVAPTHFISSDLI